MRRWDPLSERQLELLRRIGKGDDLSGPDGVPYRNSARALQSRGLVDVSRKGGGWRAEITEAGTFRLKHGYHPDHPDRQPVGSTDMRARPTVASGGGHRGSTGPRRARNAADGVAGEPPAGGIVAQARHLIEQLQGEGGTLRVESPGASTRRLYRRILHAAKQHKLVPAGFQLKFTGRDSGDIVILLSDKSNLDDTDWNRTRLNIRRDTTDPSLVFAALEEDPGGLNVTAASVPRALALVRALAAEARRRGHRVGVNKKTKHPKVYLQMGKTRRTVTFHEEYDKVRHKPTAEELRELRRSPWRTLPEYDNVPSGRLRIEVARAGYGNHDSWSDDERVRLESRLAKIIRDVEAGMAADEEARVAAQRWAEEWAAERRRQEEETRARWQEAVDHAGVQATQRLRQRAFSKAYDAWMAAGEIRALCAALSEQAVGDETTQEQRTNLSQWIAWARSEANTLDLTRNPAALVDVNFDIEPEPDDLRPFLDDWSPHHPQREYRSEQDNEQLAAVRLQAATWHHGMRGRPAWWRPQRVRLGDTHHE